MAYVRKTKKTSRRPRRYRNKQRKVLSFTKAPIPNRFATKLRYVEFTTINPGVAGIAGVHVVKANGMYDPNQTGVGHQPRGFDQLMSMYDHFTVVGARISVQFSTYANSAYSPLNVGIALKDSNSAYTDANDYLEGRNVVSRMIGATTTQSAGGISSLSKSFSTRKFLGRSKPLSDPELKGSTVTDPAELAYFHIFAAPMDTSDVDPVTISYRIDYLCVLTEPKQPAQS